MKLLEFNGVIVDSEEPDKNRIMGKIAIQPDAIMAVQEMWDITKELIPNVSMIVLKTGDRFTVAKPYSEVITELNEVYV